MNKIICILRDNNNNIEKIITIKHNSSVDNLYDLESVLQQKMKKECEYYNCTYDIESKKYFLFKKSKRNHYLVLDTDFNELPISQYLSITKLDHANITAYLEEGGIGSVEALNIFIWLIKHLGYIKSFATKILPLITILFNPFYYIKKRYNYGKQFVSDIIYLSNFWDCGFLRKLDIKNKKINEKVLMKRLHYKKENKKWVYKGEYMINRHSLKYEKY